MLAKKQSWHMIAKALPGRTAGSIERRYNQVLCKPGKSRDADANTKQERTPWRSRNADAPPEKTPRSSSRAREENTFEKLQMCSSAVAIQSRPDGTMSSPAALDQSGHRRGNTKSQQCTKERRALA